MHSQNEEISLKMLNSHTTPNIIWIKTAKTKKHENTVLSLTFITEFYSKDKITNNFKRNRKKVWNTKFLYVGFVVYLI